MIRRLFAIGRKHGWRNRTREATAAISRRQMLCATVAAGVAATVGSGRTAWAQPARPRRVAVIGGGFAGLACAAELVAAGVDALVYESESRVGGRVLTDRKFVNGAPVELGAEFIGANHPTWMALAKKYKVELTELGDSEGDEAFILEGKLLRGSALKKLHEEIDSMTAQLVELAKDIDPIRPFNAHNAVELDEQNMLEWVNNTTVSDSAKAIMIAYEESDNGVPAGRMSLLAYLSMVAGGGFADYYELSETHHATAGNDALATAMASSLGERVKLKTPVSRVERTKGKSIVTLLVGTPVEVDAVVLAVPPTVWDRIDFTPALDQELKPQFGQNTKLIIKCDKPFWTDSGVSPDIYGDGLVQIGWVSGESEKDGVAYTLFNGADRTQQMREIGSPEARVREACKSLAPAFPHLLDFVKRDLFVDWPGMPRVKGSYSFPAPGEVTRFGPTLVEGLTDGLSPLKFAGEHTAYGFMGYMEGALSSGVRIAKELIG